MWNNVGIWQDLCLCSRCSLCALCVFCCGCCPWDWVRLTNHTGCWERVYSLFYAQEMHFAFLPPGDYLLTLCSSLRRQDLWIHLSPGSNVECRLCPCSGQFYWRRLPYHCSYNLT